MKRNEKIEAEAGVVNSRRKWRRLPGMVFGIPLIRSLWYRCSESRMDAALARAGADGWPVTVEALEKAVHAATPEESAAWLKKCDDWEAAVGGPPETSIFCAHEWDRDLDEEWRVFFDHAGENAEMLNELLAYEAVPVAYDWTDCGAADLQHLENLCCLTPFLAGGFRLAVVGGDAERALGFWRDGRRAVALQKHEVTLIASLVETSFEESWFETLKATALTGGLRCFSEVQLRGMADSLEAVPVAEIFRCCAGPEMRFLVFTSSRRGLAFLRSHQKWNGRFDSGVWKHWWTVLCSYSPYSRRLAAREIDYCRRLFALLGSDWYAVRFNLPQEPKPWSGCPVLWGRSVDGDLVKTGSKLSAQRRIFRCGVALELHRRKFGHFPKRLDELVAAGLLAAVPVDPFDGKPLRYALGPHDFLWRKGIAGNPGPELSKVTRTAAVVWSVGMNCVDGGGVEGSSEDGDITFAVAAEQESK